MSAVPAATPAPKLASRRWIPVTCFGSVVFVLGLALCQLSPTETLVQIEANTEVLRLQIPRGEPLDWNVAGFKLTIDCDIGENRPALIWPEAGRRLVVRGPARVDFTRAGSNGVLRIAVSPEAPVADRTANAAALSAPSAAARAPDACKLPPVAYLSSEESMAQVPVRGTLHLSRSVDESRTNEPPALTFHVRGVPTLGDDVTGGIDHLLLSGEVTLIQTTHWRWLGKPLGVPASFVADQRKVGMGDRVIPRTSGDSDAVSGNLDANARMTGFVRVAGGKPMAAVLQGALDSVSVYRFNDSPVEVEGTLWSRIKNDPLLSYLVAALGVVYALGQLVLQTSWESYRRPQNKAPVGNSASGNAAASIASGDDTPAASASADDASAGDATAR